MIKAILITGTPGTGKTSISKIIAKHYGYKYIHIGEDKDYVVAEEDVRIIDVELMIKWLEKKQDEFGGMVVDSHLSHYFPPKRTRKCIVLRCEPSELKRRLEKRDYPQAKIDINLEAEAMDLILQEALNEGHSVYEINTTLRTPESCAEEAINAIDKDLVNYGKINFTKYIIDKALKKKSE